MSLKIQINFFFLLTLFYYGTTIAKPLPQGSKIYPPNGCEIVNVFQNNELLLNESGEQTLYLFENKSTGAIELQRNETKDVFMSPSLNATIRPNNKAAFASDVANLRFKCYKKEEGNNILVHCQDVLNVCQYPRVKFAVSNMGNYWVSVNKPLTAVIKDAVATGIYLHW